MISASDTRKMGLNVKILDDNDELWNKIWEVYYRAELEMQQSIFAKLYETTQSSVSAKATILQPKK